MKWGCAGGQTCCCGEDWPVWWVCGLYASDSHSGSLAGMWWNQSHISLDLAQVQKASFSLHWRDNCSSSLQTWPVVLKFAACQPVSSNVLCARPSLSVWNWHWHLVGEACQQTTVKLHCACRHCLLFVLSDNTERICLPGMEESDDDKLAGTPLPKLCSF